jgi:uncharacterized protein
MSLKPSEAEQEYFARQEADRRRKLAESVEIEKGEEERQRLRDLHYMRCPKCGMQLEEISVGDVRVDKCTHCEGIWLDSGELERLQGKESSFATKLRGLFGGSKEV